MGHRYSPHRVKIGHWPATAFLLAGGLLAGHAVTMALEAFTGTVPPEEFFTPLGYVIAAGGLIGLSIRWTDHRPILGWVVAGVAGVAAVGWLAITMSQIGELAGLVSAQSPVFPPVFYLGVLGTTMVAYLGFVVLPQRGRTVPDSVIGLLVAVPLLLLAVIGNALVFDGAPIGGFVVGTGLAVAHLSVGVVLRSANESPTTIGEGTVG